MNKYKLSQIGSAIFVFLLYTFAIGFNGYQIRGLVENHSQAYFWTHYSSDRKYESQFECQNKEHQDCKSILLEDYIPMDPYTDKRSEK